MKMRDYRCRSCGHEIEVLHRDGHEPDPRLSKCEKCGYCGLLKDEGEPEEPFEHVIRFVHHVRPDDVPGGFWIENLDRHPRWFPSKSAYQSELAARGLTTEQGNQWRGNPGEGSDKPANGLSRWVAPPTISEEDRIAHWHATEKADFPDTYDKVTRG